MVALAQANLFNSLTQGLVFILVLAIWLSALVIWWSARSSRVSKVHERLGLHEAQPGETRILRLWREGREITTTVEGQTKVPLVVRLSYLCHEAGWKQPVQTLIVIILVMSLLVLLMVFSLTASLLAAVGLSLTVPMLAYAFLKSRVESRLVKFEAQFVEALELASRSLRAGHPLVGAFQLISREMGDPVSTVFAEICQLQSLGLSLEDSIRRTSAASSSPDMKLFATSVVMQLRSGGNLADMMHRLAAVIRDRMRLKRRVRVLTAQTTMSKRVLLMLPLVLFVGMHLLSPQYMSLLHMRSEGRWLMAMGALGMVLGAWMMNRLSVIKY